MGIQTHRDLDVYQKALLTWIEFAVGCGHLARETGERLKTNMSS